MWSRNSADFTGHLEACRLWKWKKDKTSSAQADLVEISCKVVILGIVCHEWCMVGIIILDHKDVLHQSKEEHGGDFLTCPEQFHGPGWPGHDAQLLPWNAWKRAVLSDYQKYKGKSHKNTSLGFWRCGISTENVSSTLQINCGEPTHLKGMISFWEITFLRYLVALGIRLHMIRNHHIHIRRAKGTCVLGKGSEKKIRIS